jgi:VanZ family protein
MFIKYNYPGMIWAVVILILLGLPASDIPDTSFINIPHLDKIIHSFLFFVLVFLLARGFVLQNKFIFINKFSFLSSLTLGIIYGGLTEILQGSVFASRSSDLFDFIFDVLGCCSGLLFFIFLKRRIVAPHLGK